MPSETTIHCRACRQEYTSCLCNTCKLDCLLITPACCYITRQGDDTRCPICACRDYEPEEPV